MITPGTFIRLLCCADSCNVEELLLYTLFPRQRVIMFGWTINVWKTSHPSHNANIKMKVTVKMLESCVQVWKFQFYLDQSVYLQGCLKQHGIFHPSRLCLHISDTVSLYISGEDFSEFVWSTQNLPATFAASHETRNHTDYYWNFWILASRLIINVTTP